ncbi:gluconate permease [Salinisphaera sp. USBA-960]|uniref:gluconate:H+ symporter n=1 Tax=Salinisphaera orenii TaxID=856731 RepID=UPI000DBE3114|nr:gluconate permease [Salifodinibacter halophilus]NNC25938.1 gluconate permease [Salifodinibacter halophilus]
MPLVITVLGLALLLFLIMKLKVHTFISLAIVTFLLALALGIPLDKIVDTVESGFGDTLASTGLIFGFGAILGKLIADAGGAQRIAVTLVARFGERNIQWSVVLVSVILGIALFFEIGIVLLVPIVYQMAKQVRLPLLYLGLPMTVGLSVMHGFLPPHPGPVVIASQFHANVGLVLLYGFIIAIPTVIIAGPVFTFFALRMVPSAFDKDKKPGAIAVLGDAKQFDLEQTPNFGISVFTAAFPVILMALATLVSLAERAFGLADNPVTNFIHMISEPTTVMFLAVVVAIFTMGIQRGIPIPRLMESAETSVKTIALLLLIIGISGSLKQVLIEGGVGDYVATLFEGSDMSPILLVWLIAAVIRITLGSATVAALTTAGLALPLIQGSGANFALITLATGSGSLIASHVNDTGFWMVKEAFGLTMKETFCTWTVLETIISVCGLVFALMLSTFV